MNSNFKRAFSLRRTVSLLVGDRRAGDGAAQVFELPALIGATAHSRVQATAVRVGAQRLSGFSVSTGQRLQR